WHRLAGLILLPLLLGACGPAKETRAEEGPQGEDTSKSSASGSWNPVSAGVEIGRFPAPGSGGREMHVMRVDPATVELVLLSASVAGHEPLTADQWAKKYGLLVVINAGMFNTDHATHTGYMKQADAVLSANVRKDYSSAAAFLPLDKECPLFRMHDL